MSAIQDREMKAWFGLRCDVRVAHGDRIWHGKARVQAVNELHIELPDQLVPSFCEGNIVRVEIDSQVLGQTTMYARVVSLETYGHSGDKLCTRIVTVDTHQDQVSGHTFWVDMDKLQPLIVSVGIGERLSERDYLGFRLKETTSIPEVERLLEEDMVAVIVFGPVLKPLQMRSLLLSRSERKAPRSINIILYDKTPQSAFQDMLDDDMIFYISHVSIAAKQLRSTVDASLRCYTEQLSATKIARPAQDDEEYLSSLCQRLTRKTDLPGVTCAISEELARLLGATKARCLFYDPENEMLYADDSERGLQEAISVVAGVVGYVARTGELVRVESLTKDPRYDPVADNPGETRGAHFIAHAILAADGATIGVLIATRPSYLSPFAEADEKRITKLEKCVAPLLSMFLSDMQKRQSYLDSDGSHRNLFRKEALEFQNSAESEGKLLRKIPLWLAWSPCFALLFVAVGFAYIFLARVSKVVTGPAVIRTSDTFTIASLRGGVVAALSIKPGDRVIPGELLMTLRGVPDNSGRNITPPVQEDVRASTGGFVSGVSIQIGQMVAPGDKLMTLRGQVTTSQVLILLPGSSAPELHVGMPLVLKIESYPHSPEKFTITDIAPDLIEPSEAAWLIGKELPQAMSSNGPLLLVRATLLHDTFVVGSEKLRYQDGMTGQAEIVVSEEPLITTLMPGINRRFSLGRGRE